MSGKILYLIGQPGAGKSTALARALEGVPWGEVKNPVPHVLYPRGIQLGRKRDVFGGTDTLAMNIQPKVLEWLGTHPYETIVAEGDRLANAAFFMAVQRMGYDLTVAHIDTDSLTAAERRRERSRAAGAALQNESWVRGRVTKTERLAVSYAHQAWILDGAPGVESIAARLREHPVIAQIRGDALQCQDC